MNEKIERKLSKFAKTKDCRHVKVGSPLRLAQMLALALSHVSVSKEWWFSPV